MRRLTFGAETSSRMATYRQIQERVRSKAGFVPRTCWIAHVKADHGLTLHKAPNRYEHPTRSDPCPTEKRAAIQAALQHFGMV
jgi:hypothetical protein